MQLGEANQSITQKACTAERYSKSGKRVWEEVGKNGGKAITEKLKREQIFPAPKNLA